MIHAVQFLCFLTQIPGMLDGNHFSIFCGGLCLGVFLTILIDEML